MNARGIANYMEAGAYRARGIIEGYAFPESDKAKVILPPPTKDLIVKYYRAGQRAQLLHDTINRHSPPVLGETRFQKSRRRQMVQAAQHLLTFGNAYEFRDIQQRPYASIINGLRVKASYDFTAKTPGRKGDKLVCVIFNVAHEISDNVDRLTHHAKIESEIAFEIVRNHLPIEEVWYVDLPGEKLARPPLKKSLVSVWRDIETACDDILLKYNAIVARRSRVRQ
jgi:hypothetical protein